MKLMKKIHDKLGFDQCKIFISGAAPLLKPTRDFFLSIGIYIFNLYGLSETTAPMTAQYPYETHYYKPLSCGRSLKTLDIKIAEDGEVICRGRSVFMGYLNLVEKTKEVFTEQGYFRTGDLGRFDEDGFLYITGRKKEILITAAGENVAPYPIENNIMKKIKAFASHVIVIGDARKYLTALIAPKNLNPALQVPVDELEEDAKKYLIKKGIVVDKIS